MRLTEVAIQGLPPMMRRGPLHTAMRHARLLGADGLPRAGTAFLLGVGAWLVGALLAVAQWRHTGNAALLQWFADASPIAHTLVALPALLAGERATEVRLRRLLEYPLRQRLIAAAAADAYRDAVARAERRSGSALGELAMLATAVLICMAFVDGTIATSAHGSSRMRGGDGPSWAGFWLHYAVGVPLVFLLLRWLLRFLVWTLVLATLARLPLALLPLHADRAGGLGYLAAYPSLFDRLVLAASATVGAKMFNASVQGTAALDELAGALVTWLAVVLVVFVGPLLIFWMRLARLRADALMEYGAFVDRAHRAARDAAGADAPGDSPSPRDVPALVALNALFDRAAGIQPLLVSRQTVTQLITVAALPALPSLATHVPMSRLIELFLGGLR